MCVHSSMYRSIQLLWEEYNTHLSKVVSSLNHALIIQFFKVYRLEGKWVLGHAVFGGVVRHGMPRNFSLGCRIDQQV